MRFPYLLFLLIVSCAWAAENPATGKWDCKSKDATTGQELSWTLVVKEEGGKLSGSLLGGPENPGEIPLVEPKLEGDIFTFRIDVNPNCVVRAKVKIEGKKLAGQFGCTEAAGSFKGTKQS